MVTCSFACTLAIMYLFPQELQRGLGLSSTTSGIVMLPGGIINAVVAFVTGRMFDRHGATRLVRVGAVVAIVGSVLFILLGVDSPLWFIIVAHVVFMVGIPLMQQASQSAAFAGLPRELSADGSTILNTMQQVVAAIGTAVATILLGFGQMNTLASAGASQAEGFVTGSRYGYVFGAVLVLVSLGFSFVLREKRNVVLEEVDVSESAERLARES